MHKIYQDMNGKDRREVTSIQQLTSMMQDRAMVEVRKGYALHLTPTMEVGGQSRDEQMIACGNDRPLRSKAVILQWHNG